MKFLFNLNAKLRALAEHAIKNHTHQRQVYTENDKMLAPALLLVKDEGVYLMSCFVSAKAPKSARLKESGKLVVVYAIGFEPEGGYIGGDDFGTDLEGLPEMIAKHPTARIIEIRLNGNRVNYAIY